MFAMAQARREMPKNIQPVQHAASAANSPLPIPSWHLSSAGIARRHMMTLKQDYFVHTRPEMLAFVPERRDRVLEIGCSSGLFSAGIPGTRETWGVEPSDAAATAATRLTRVLHGTYASVAHDIPDAYFDVIICNDVIEHMTDHASFLRTVSRHLAPGGRLVGSVPNVQFYNNTFRFLLEKDWMYEEDGILDRTHVAFFTRKSLVRTLNEAGWRVAVLRGINAGAMFDEKARTRMYRALGYLLGYASFGYWRDLRYLQFAFVAAPAGSDAA